MEDCRFPVKCSPSLALWSPLPLSIFFLLAGFALLWTFVSYSCCFFSFLYQKSVHSFVFLKKKVYIVIHISILDAVSLVGESAPPEVLQKLTYLAMRHDPQIKRVDTVRAYTFGVLYFVEVRISFFVLLFCIYCSFR